VDTEKGSGGAGDEDADLVDGAIRAVEGAIFGKGGGGEGEEESGCDALINGVLGNVDKEEGEHAVRR